MGGRSIDGDNFNKAARVSVTAAAIAAFFGRFVVPSCGLSSRKPPQQSLIVPAQEGIMPQQTAQVNEMLLRGRTLLQLRRLPFGDERLRIQSVSCMSQVSALPVGCSLQELV